MRVSRAWVVFTVALLARLSVVAWGHARFPAVEDGHYYDVLAHRLASGAGYTWLWPDGAVTAVAHYPVGYPALLAAAYALFGGSVGVAMTVNAALGAAGACAVCRLADGNGIPRWRPFAAGAATALHPALVPYTAAVMTEGVTASLLVIAAAAADHARRGGRRAPAWVAAAGVAMGVATLVRPQSLLFAPVVGALATSARSGALSRLTRAAVVSAIALACVAPWTARNCVSIHKCALVSVNQGWNLLIGVQTTSGAWAPLSVPPECATVWDEAAKDACFERVARRDIAARPGPWIARAPAKLATTFDYFGAAPWYLHASNAAYFPDRAKARLGAFETVACRLILLAALVAFGRYEGRRRLARKLVALAGAAGAVSVHGWIGYAALVVCVGLMGGRAALRAPTAVLATAAITAITAAVHVVFFGAGRYGLVVVPFLTAAAFTGSGARGGCAVRVRDAHSTRSTPLGRSPVPPVHVRPADALPAREESPSSTEHDAG